MPYHTPAQAAKIAGCSVASLRNYTARFAAHFSPHALPPPGTPRRFTDADVRLVRFIADMTAAGGGLDAVQRALEDGQLADYDWQPPGALPDAGQPAPEAGAALVLMAQTLTAQLEAARSALESARQREADLQRLVGQLEGKLEGRRPWWVRLFRG